MAKRASAAQIKVRNTFKANAKKAKRLYASGRYSTFADAMKAASKGKARIGKVKSKPKYRQTGSSNSAYDKRVRAKPPGKRRSKSGRIYMERRKNRSDMPGSLTGVNQTALRELQRNVNNLSMLEKQRTIWKNSLMGYKPKYRRPIREQIKRLSQLIQTTKRNISNLKKSIR